MKINRESLIEKLESVSPGLSVRDVIEQSSCFVFRDGKVLTFNDEIACSQECNLGIEGAVHSFAFINILKKLIEEELEFVEEKGEIIIKGKNKACGITREAEIQLPIENVEQPKKWTTLSEGFIEAIELVQHCASSDDSSFALTCIHISPDFVEACDNSQMTRVKLKTKMSKSILVRRDSIKHIVSLSMREFCETETWIHFKNESGMVLSCRRFIDEYVDLNQFLEFTGKKITLPKGLADAVDKASIFITLDLENPQVKVMLMPDKLRIKSVGASGWYRESKQIKYSGESIAFLIAPKLLIDITKKYNEAEIGPGRLKVNGGNWTYISCLSPIEE